MGSKKKIGVRVDEDLWDRFKKYVEDKHGRTRSVTASEVETALRNHLEADNPTEPITRIEHDIATIKAVLADERADADGGDATIADPPAPSEPDHTHTPNDHTYDDERPPQTDAHVADETSKPQTSTETNASTSDDVPHDKATKGTKAAYVFDQFDGSPGVDGVVIPPAAIDKKIDKIWGFGPRAADPLRRKVFDKYHATAVATDEDGWGDGDAFVALGETPEDVDDAIDAWAEDPETVRVVPHEHFDGFEGGRPQTK